jgi:hypothetical protein
VVVRAVAVLAVALLLSGCREESAFQSPELGASDGEVRLVPQGDLAPNARITVEVQADAAQELTGGICFMIYRWSPGFGPGPDWVVDARQNTNRKLTQDEATCPAVGASLPTSFMFTLPDLDDGTYRVTYEWGRAEDQPGERLPQTGTAGYTFAVGAPSQPICLGFLGHDGSHGDASQGVGMAVEQGASPHVLRDVDLSRLRGGRRGCRQLAAGADSRNRDVGAAVRRRAPRGVQASLRLLRAERT